MCLAYSSGRADKSAVAAIQWYGIECNQHISGQVRPTGFPTRLALCIDVQHALSLSSYMHHLMLSANSTQWLAAHHPLMLSSEPVSRLIMQVIADSCNSKRPCMCAKPSLSGLLVRCRYCPPCANSSLEPLLAAFQEGTARILEKQAALSEPQVRRSHYATCHLVSTPAC